MLVMAVAGVSFSGTNVKARDGRRMADIERIRTALELYRQQQGVYPADGTDLIADYLSAWPEDPKDFEYSYVQESDYTYSLYAKMEDVGSTTGVYAATCGAEVCNYLVSNP